MTDLSQVCLEGTSVPYPISLNSTSDLQALISYPPQPTITIIDRPCGSGKTTAMLRDLRKDYQYLCVVPFLSEVERVIRSTNVSHGEGFFVQPSDEEGTTKTEDIRSLLIEGRNVVTTHALFSNLAPLCKEGLLDDYHTLIDEVPEPVKLRNKPKPKPWQDIYLGLGYVTTCPISQKVQATEKWRADPEGVDDTLSSKLFSWAVADSLYLYNDD